MNNSEVTTELGHKLLWPTEEKLLPFSYKKASYLNACNPDEDTVENAYQHNLERLKQIKMKYDPTNRFRHNHTIEVTNENK